MELRGCCFGARGAGSRGEGFGSRAFALGFEVAPATSAEGQSESCRIDSVALLASIGGLGRAKQNEAIVSISMYINHR